MGKKLYYVKYGRQWLYQYNDKTFSRNCYFYNFWYYKDEKSALTCIKNHISSRSKDEPIDRKYQVSEEYITLVESLDSEVNSAIIDMIEKYKANNSK